MISLSPINKKIRQTLSDKADAVARDYGGADPLKSQTDGVREKFISTNTRAVWVRMFSPVDSTIRNVDTGEKDKDDNAIYNPVPGDKYGMRYSTIMGGETKGFDGTITDDNPLMGYEELYTQRAGNKDGILEPRESGFKRPMAGIKTIDVSYKGGLSAVREATINWTCWSFEDLQRLTPHFLAHGKGVLLEWGWSTPESLEQLIFTHNDMIDGTAYNNLQSRIIELKGVYDGMAGIISNWEWTVRDDGGLDCTTKIVSRGVNMLTVSIDEPGKPTGATDSGEDGEEEVSPSLQEFVLSLKEQLMAEAVEGEGWFDFKGEKTLLPHNNTNLSWETDASQMPGSMLAKTDGLFSGDEMGPYVTWGFLEDNILNRYVGRYENSSGRSVASVRSLDPVMSQDESGEFLDNDGNNTTEISKTKFQSTIIRNHNHLYTIDMGRWILPGQFPGQFVQGEKADVAESGWLGYAASWIQLDHVVNFAIDAVVHTDWDEELIMQTARWGSAHQYYKRFAVNETNWNEGGYLRNILISYELIEESFTDAKTLTDGMNSILSTINSDVDGFWQFQIVDDPYVSGNIKVVDMNRTQFTVEELLNDHEEKGNPDSKLFVFNSWGEKSIVKSQNLSAKLPSSMAVTAMYAGTSTASGTGNMGEGPGTQVGSLNNQALDESQQNIKMAWQNPEDVGQKGGEYLSDYGSSFPFGTIGDDKQHYESDNDKTTNIPSGELFGPQKGISFSKLNLMDLVKYMFEKLDWGSEEKDADKVNEDTKEKEEKQRAQRSRSPESLKQFKRVTGHGGTATGDSFKGMFSGNGDPVTLSQEQLKEFSDGNWGSSKYGKGITMYDAEGLMHAMPEFHVLFRDTMIQILQGNITDVSQEDRNKVEPLCPVELEITLDGVGGILPGNVFHIDYIPEDYRKYCVFQAMSVDHSVGVSAWDITIRGQLRIAANKITREKLADIKGSEKRLQQSNKQKTDGTPGSNPDTNPNDTNPNTSENNPSGNTPGSTTGGTPEITPELPINNMTEEDQETLYPDMSDDDGDGELTDEEGQTPEEIAEEEEQNNTSSPSNTPTITPQQLSTFEGKDWQNLAIYNRKPNWAPAGPPFNNPDFPADNRSLVNEGDAIVMYNKRKAYWDTSIESPMAGGRSRFTGFQVLSSIVEGGGQKPYLQRIVEDGRLKTR